LLKSKLSVINNITDEQKIKRAVKSFYSKGRRHNRNEMNRLLSLIDELFKTTEAIPVIENLTVADTIEYYQYVEEEYVKNIENYHNEETECETDSTL